MRVRYLLPLRNDTLLALRCKLNLPRIDAAQPERLKGVNNERLGKYHEYDGWLSCRSPFATFMFAKRPGTGRLDYVHFITEYGRLEDGHFRIYGRYLTLSQGNPQVITTDALIMERKLFENDPDRIMRLMRKTAVIRGGQCEELDRLLAASQAARPPLDSPLRERRRGRVAKGS